MMETKGTPPVDPNPDVLDPGEPFSHYLQVLRGSVRPLVTLVLVGALVFGFAYVIRFKDVPMEVMNGIIIAVVSMATTVVGVWFGQRR